MAVQSVAVVYYTQVGATQTDELFQKQWWLVHSVSVVNSEHFKIDVMALHGYKPSDPFVSARHPIVKHVASSEYL